MAPRPNYRTVQESARARVETLATRAAAEIAADLRRMADQLAGRLSALPGGAAGQRAALEASRRIVAASAADFERRVAAATARARDLSFQEVRDVWLAAQRAAVQAAGIPGEALPAWLDGVGAVEGATFGRALVPRVTMAAAYARLSPAATWQTALKGHTANAAADLDRIVREGILGGADPFELARRLRPYVQGAESFERAFPKTDDRFARLHDLRGVPADLKGAARRLNYNATRIAVTETWNARAEAELEAFAVDPMVYAVKWTLAPNRGALRKPDVCDAYAGTDWYGLGVGVFPLDAVPLPPHPFDRCTRVPLLRSPNDWRKPKPAGLARKRQVTDAGGLASPYLLPEQRLSPVDVDAVKAALTRGFRPGKVADPARVAMSKLVTAGDAAAVELADVLAGVELPVLPDPGPIVDPEPIVPPPPPPDPVVVAPTPALPPPVPEPPALPTDPLDRALAEAAAVRAKLAEFKALTVEEALALPSGPRGRSLRDKFESIRTRLVEGERAIMADPRFAARDELWTKMFRAEADTSQAFAYWNRLDHQVGDAKRAIAQYGHAHGLTTEEVELLKRQAAEALAEYQELSRFSTRLRAEYTALDRALEPLITKVDALRERLRKVGAAGTARAKALAEASRAKGRALVERPAAEWGTLAPEFWAAKGGPAGRVDPRFAAKAAEGFAAFNRMVGKVGHSPVQRVIRKAGRANASVFEGANGPINMALTDGVGVWAHELSHFWEFNEPEVWKASQRFHARRTAGEKLQKIYPGSKGKMGREVARFDKYRSPYAGKEYTFNNANRGTNEIVAMGVQWMVEDAAAFAREDPDYFDFIFALIRTRTGK